MLRLVLILWLATIGADRIDFFSGVGPFGLTPFLVISPMIWLFAFFKGTVARPKLSFTLPKNMPQFMSLASVLVLLVLASVLLSDNAGLGLKRFALLAFEISTCIFTAVVLYNLPGARKILVTGAWCGLVLMLLFDVAQFIRWFPNPLSNLMGSIPFVDTKPQALGLFAPRLSGMSIDANRGAVLAGIYAFFILKFGRKSIYRSLFIYGAIVILAFTFSRSAIAAFAVSSFLLLLQSDGLRLTRIAKAAASLSIIVLIAAFFFANSQIGLYVNMSRLLSERASFSSEDSGGIHMAVFQTGLDVASSSLKNFAIGIGFGNSYKVLEEFYGQNELGNFHSIYLSFLAESGVFSLLALLALLFIPLLKSKNYGPLMAGLILFNCLYQLTLEPIFWLSLVFYWTNVGFTASLDVLQADSWRAQCG